uniref:UDP-galactopyranose mutase C-terminal domain-containing protein n=1 Tax=Magnetococcus massalia (strain MO-1) TaxID=451514 RepID=A0A1S7LR74_MAGMO|nr:NAD(P)-binding protein [Candidatus Magnetococcus massalia]CRH08277.1 conserved protein of unknown function [Candidatus Magnetococcus massalia]CRH08301.1 conserved protein of unknown function. fragment of UDP-galactopyranose mutase [Candidatus Magnetococcus massalia]
MYFQIVGSGLTGAVIARILADHGHHCHVYEALSHVAGHCHTERDSRTGILKHCFGPHTLHSDSQKVWDFLQRFTTIMPYQHRKEAWIRGKLYPFPVNLTAINKLFGRQMTPQEAEAVINQEAAPYREQTVTNFAEAALSSIGPTIYEAYYKGYTQKQWGRAPEALPAFIFRRIPIHLSDEQNVFHLNR